MKHSHFLFALLLILPTAIFTGIYCGPANAGPQGEVVAIGYIDESGQEISDLGARVETWVVGYQIEAAWGASDRTGAIFVQTDALSLTPAEAEQVGPDRLYNDLISALAKQGITIRAKKDKLIILGWSKPLRKDMVIETPLFKPKQ